MRMTPPSWILVPMVLSSAGAFFMDTKDPIIFQDGGPSFGHQVAQLNEQVIVSAPLQVPTATQTGQFYSCDPDTRQCRTIQIPAGSDDGINMSLGLSLAVQGKSPQILVCGATLQRECGTNMHVNGRCHQLDVDSSPRCSPTPFRPESKSPSLDIVFLIDGSGSVYHDDFQKMLTFISRIMESMNDTDTQFALMQYSSSFQTHFDFKRFSSIRDPKVLTSNIRQMQELTRTATGIYKVITELFVPSSGARDKAVKLLIVITDGQIYGDDRRLEDSTNEAKRRGIVSFAIGVGSAFTSPKASAELQTIASSDDQLFRVTDFSALSQFQNTLQDKIFAMEECKPPSLDIVFLIDGSGSVARPDFTRMLTFVSTIMSSFRDTDTQFALMQYSSSFETHFDFKRFFSVRDPTVLTSNIQQMQELTRTATGIYKVITELFVPSSGARDEAVKLLIVITDGQIYGDDRRLEDSTNEAKRRGIVSFAVGVGSAFNSRAARAELQTIASSNDQIFKIDDFSALSQFQKTLQDKIFAITGTKSPEATSFQMEMSQEGFSAVLTEDGPIPGAIDAFDWSGGISVYKAGQHNCTWTNVTKDQTIKTNSYTGYAVQKVAKDIIAIGAPRYQHTGKVLIYRRDARNGQWTQVATANGEQIGSYFGSVLSVHHENSEQPILVVGAPTYYSPEVPSGRVYLCQVRNSQALTISCPETLQGDANQPVGQFGAAVSVLPDLTGDNLPDLAVGAPYEDNYQGAIYIFAGQERSFRTSYIQRVTGNLVSSGIKFFGRSLSGNKDMTKDGIPDVTIGGEGRVVILKSRPVIAVSVSMTFNPPKIGLSSYECPSSRKQEPATTITLCFSQELKSPQAKGAISAEISYTLLLDSALAQTRAVFSQQPPDTRTVSRSIDVMENCVQHPIYLPECVEDSLTPLRVSLSYSLMGNPVLSEDTRTSHAAEVPFERNCGGDEVCEDDLRLAINFTGVTQLVVGTFLDINVTVSVESLKDDSYNTRVLIPFPVGLSYRLVSPIWSNKKVTILCSTLEGQSVVNCAINRPLLRPNTTAVFKVGFHVSSTAELGKSLLMVANVTSDNKESAINRRMSSARVDVLYAVDVTITSLEESSKYENFTSDNSSMQHIYRVNNLGQRGLPLFVIFLLPVKLGESSVWEKINISSSQPEITNCTMTGETQGAKNVKDLLNQSPVVNCSVGRCVRVECFIRELEPKISVVFRVNGSVTKNWTSQTEQKKITWQSWAEIVYDNRTYHQSQPFTRAQAQTVLEVPTEYNYAPIIIGSSVGGLVLLALITAALYKLGFFKRQYKDMLDNSAGGEAVKDDAPLEPQNVG